MVFFFTIFYTHGLGRLKLGQLFITRCYQRLRQFFSADACGDLNDMKIYIFITAMSPNFYYLKEVKIIYCFLGSIKGFAS